MKFYVSHSIKEIEENLSRVRKDEWGSLSIRFREELGIPTRERVVITGHQPILYYPGIFTKLILAYLISCHIGGRCYYIVLDVDQQFVDWKFLWFQNGIYREDFLLSNPKEVLLNQILQGDFKKKLFEKIREWRLHLYSLFEPSVVPKIQKALDFTEELFSKKNQLTISELSTGINQFIMKELGFHVQPIYLSKIIKTQSFFYLVDFIKKNYKIFQLIYNQTLDEFRKKYHEYFFSYLKNDELPLWKSDGYKRETLKVNDDLSEIPYIFPKAFMLSFIIRMFLSDLMIHGTGGGFYDQVTETIIERFLEQKPSPCVVTTSTFYLQPKASFSVDYPSVEEIRRKLRKWKFNPEIFLDNDCELRLKKLYLIHLKNYLDSQFQKIKRNYVFDDSWLNHNIKNEYVDLQKRIQESSESYGYHLHQEFLKLNHKMHLYSLGIKRNLMSMLKKAQEADYHRRIFFDRTYPIFYYDYEKIYEQIRNDFIST
ncbi:MAG: hypothetical protein NZ853_00065 [Leptospiraceae bacterium]|nr:hypothetical protein [Leptospiraceae bacterium]MDW7976377.1 hypothetical protein [Leptospiraceae bacterium]